MRRLFPFLFFFLLSFLLAFSSVLGQDSSDSNPVSGDDSDGDSNPVSGDVDVDVDDSNPVVGDGDDEEDSNPVVGDGDDVDDSNPVVGDGDPVKKEDERRDDDGDDDDDRLPVSVDQAPSVTISVPASATPGSLLSIVVSGFDDRAVSRLSLFDSFGSLLDVFDCLGVQASCSRTFFRLAPSSFSTAYTFLAQSRDSANQLSGLVSGSGFTSPSPPLVFSPAPVSGVQPLIPVSQQQPAKPLAAVAVKFPIFLRSLQFSDSDDCLKPGESALLAINVQNKGRSTLKDVKFSASVPELGIRSSFGPFKLTTKDKSARFMSIDVPEFAEPGTYYLRFTISDNRFSRAVHRQFVVDNAC